MTTFKDWMKKQFERDEMEDIVNHGANSGFHGLIYTRETTSLYKKYFEEIWDMLEQDADDQGVTILEMISKFNGAVKVGSHDELENLLVWYAAEKIAFNIIELGDDDDETDDEEE